MRKEVNALSHTRLNYGPYGNTCNIDGWMAGHIAWQLNYCALGFNSY